AKAKIAVAITKARKELNSYRENLEAVRGAAEDGDGRKAYHRASLAGDHLANGFGYAAIGGGIRFLEYDRRSRGGREKAKKQEEAKSRALMTGLEKAKELRKRYPKMPVTKITDAVLPQVKDRVKPALTKRGLYDFLRENLR
ncbi:unnamed protein product, partial [marine sediment metagenome]